MATVTSMGNVHRYVTQLGDQELIIETGKFAEQAGGAVTVQVGQTVVFATTTMSKSAREGIDFFPLSVDYEEKLYAAGRIPGSYFRREGRPSESAILISRVVDRPLRPLFPEYMRNEVQIIFSALSHDQENQVDMIGIIAASTALMISDIPWEGPVAAVRIGLIDGEFVINPTIPQMEDSILDLRVAGTGDAINMVECAAVEIDEETMIRALMLAHETMQPIIEMQKQIAAEIGKPKSEFISSKIDESIETQVAERAREAVRQALIETTDRTERTERLDAVRSELLAAFEAQNATLAEGETPVEAKAVKQAFEDVIYEEVRRRIVSDGVRPDGRDYTTIRPLAAEVGIIPRVHGSGLFKRGQTQVMTIATLGTPRDAQSIETVSPEESRRYMHHYNFPPYSTGETSPLRGPKRREI
ncbi:MAG: polyribonucleotide nucleotidyltransferase, partial [Anaerolineae bacterium]|nr:polyribonucleotide nucleotidyltransferase [Anaerolineae bacterium]